MPDNVTVVDGDDSFVLGMDSYTSPNKLLPGEYVAAMNIITRGGMAQTRPGSLSILDLPEGNLQGVTMFAPSSLVQYLVFAVEGKIYASPSPFREYAQIEGIQFNKASKYIAWASTIQSSTYTDSGVLEPLNDPKSILIMQDGVTRAAYWDGTTARHLNPTQSNEEFTPVGFDETPVGLWMVWSNNRLWVSQGVKVFASDIGNPLKFTETQYLNEARAFFLPAPCTGMVETSDRQGIICFTTTSGIFLMSSIQDRDLWLSTPLFQQTILPEIGCVAPRSIVLQYGLIWWWSAKGLINQNDALRLNISSRLDVQDNEMFQSKAYLSGDLSMVCGGYMENFLFHGVPNGELLNTRVHVLDQAPFEGNVNTWPSWWMGWRPVEFTKGVISTKERVFCASRDYDGRNRIWELFRADKTDNGIPITCWLATKRHFFQHREYKKFKYAEIELEGIKGPVATMVAVGGLRGAPQIVMTKDINSTNGQMYSGQIYGYQANDAWGSRAQTRIVLTTEDYATSECNNACIESQKSGLRDKCFYLVLVWSGIAGISMYRIFATSDDRPDSGACEDHETDEERIKTPLGCGELDLFSVKEPFPEYFARVAFTRTNEDGETASWTSLQSSFISQVDATRKATKMSEWHVLKELGELI